MDDSVSRQFVKSFSDDFLVEIVRIIESGYGAARRATMGIDWHVRPNVAGVQRWGIIETGIMKLADEHDVEAEWVPNSVRSAHHVEIRNGRFLATVAKTEERGKLPDDAEFRKTLIAASQLRLFPVPNAEGDHILAIIVHGPDENAHGARFVDVLFPDPDGVIVDRVDLMQLARVPTAEDVSAEAVPDRARPALQPAANAASHELIGDAAQPTVREVDETGTTDS